jgi:hypothetical protein
VFFAQASVRSREAIACCFVLASVGCSGDRKAAAPPAAAASVDSHAVIPGLTPAPAPSSGATAPAPNLGLVPLPDMPPDTAAGLLKQFELTLPKLEKWAKAQSALNVLTKQNPQMLPRLQAQAAPKTLDQMIAMIGSEPKIRAALKQNGSTPRDYVLTMIAMQQAMQGYARVAEGKPLPNDLPPATAANIVFVQKNMPAIQQVLATIEK